MLGEDTVFRECSSRGRRGEERGAQQSSNAPFATGASLSYDTTCTLARAESQAQPTSQTGLETSPRPMIGSSRSHRAFSHPPSVRTGSCSLSIPNCNHIRKNVQGDSRAECSLGQWKQPPLAVRSPWHMKVHTHCRASWALRVPRKFQTLKLCSRRRKDGVCAAEPAQTSNRLNQGTHLSPRRRVCPVATPA